MDNLVKFIWAFWFIVIIGFVIAAITVAPWLAILFALGIIIAIAVAIVNWQDKRDGSNKTEKV